MFNTDGTLIVFACSNGSMRVWEVDSGESLKVLDGHSDWVMSAHFNLSGSLIVSASYDKTIRIWDTETG